MVSALESGPSGLGPSPGRGHCVVFFSKTLPSHSASLHIRGGRGSVTFGWKGSVAFGWEGERYFRAGGGGLLSKFYGNRT